VTVTALARCDARERPRLFCHRQQEQLVGDCDGGIRDASNNLARARWSPELGSGASGAGRARPNGTCANNKGGIKKAATAVTFSVSSVTRSGSTYNAGANADSDGDSNGTTITIARP
jgi:hypothetical protein